MMKVFLSWSGTRSKMIAEDLHEWLPSVIQAISPWMSASDIDKGARWSSDIATQLEETRFGIICLTPENLEAPWILFEAGALSKTLENTFVCPFLFDVEPTDLKGPLVQFQAAKAVKEDTKKLVQTINQALQEDALPQVKSEKTFEVWWPELEEKLKAIPQMEEAQAPQRTERELLQEILDLVRTQTRVSLTTTREAIEDVGNDYVVVARPKLQADILSILGKEEEGLSSRELKAHLNRRGHLFTARTLSRTLNLLLDQGLLIKVATETGVTYKLK